jgi:hypothetical protein
MLNVAESRSSPEGGASGFAIDRLAGKLGPVLESGFPFERFKDILGTLPNRCAPVHVPDI